MNIQEICREIACTQGAASGLDILEFKDTGRDYTIKLRTGSDGEWFSRISYTQVFEYLATELETLRRAVSVISRILPDD